MSLVFCPLLGAQRYFGLWVWLVVAGLDVFGIAPPSGCSTKIWILGVVGSGVSGCVMSCHNLN